ncbi:hypothetical protein EDD22DRAFT_957004 [Suillus occidentalis]|nr:hypothetical protein EDD22DRAFT_957004 [Suillus occidentalis]
MSHCSVHHAFSVSTDEFDRTETSHEEHPFETFADAHTIPSLPIPLHPQCIPLQNFRPSSNSKEHLKALKVDEEEAYMKLIDTAKDMRITHLLWQTDAYLNSLAQATVAQQNESGPLDTNFDQENEEASVETRS